MTHSVTSILSQIRSFQTQASQTVARPLAEMPRSNAIPGTTGVGAPAPASFSETLRGALAGVNESQQTAARSRGTSNSASPGPTWPG